MKTEPKFKCGDIVAHKTSGLNRFLIMGVGTVTDDRGQSDNIYFVSFDHMGTPSRAYILEFEIELYNPKR